MPPSCPEIVGAVEGGRAAERGDRSVIDEDGTEGAVLRCPAIVHREVEAARGGRRRQFQRPARRLPHPADWPAATGEDEFAARRIGDVGVAVKNDRRGAVVGDGDGRIAVGRRRTRALDRIGVDLDDAAGRVEIAEDDRLLRRARRIDAPCCRIPPTVGSKVCPTK